MTKRPGNPTDLQGDLTWEALISVLSYDPITGDFRWRAVTHGRVRIGGLAGGSLVDGGYRKIRVNGHLYRAARLAWFYMTKQWPEALIDHKNGNRADDRWANLRPATRKENAINHGKSKANTSGVTGVYWYDRNQKWGVIISANGKREFLGLFDTREEAIAVRQRAETERFGDFVRRA